MATRIVRCCLLVLLMAIHGFVGDSTVTAQPNNLLTNPSFELGATGWQGATTRVSEYDAPVTGVAYAIAPAGAIAAVQATDVVIQPNTTYTLSGWARSVYSDEHLARLRDGRPEQIPTGVAAQAVAELELRAGDISLARSARSVNPVALRGAPETLTNDDGGNVWVDRQAGYRHAFSENHFYQPITSNPIDDPWLAGRQPLAFNQADMLAKTGAIFPDGAKRLYGFNSVNPFCTGTGETCQAVLFAGVAGGGAPLYDVPDAPDENYVVWNSGGEDPWLGDPHVYVDADKRAWLTLGGGTGIYVSELDPATGLIKGQNGAVRFDDRPDLFTKVADWSGDEWTFDSTWMEGAALHQHGDHWYLFTSAGDLSLNYTIRVGRGDNPRGPFFDKAGRRLDGFDTTQNEYGGSFLLGDDADQLVPGHPHLWQEGDETFLGYDYRLAKEGQAGSEVDYLGVRRIEWVDGWPTVWRPLSVSFDSATAPDAIGRSLSVLLRNTGEAGSHIALDALRLTASVTLAGDYNNNGTVDVADYTVWRDTLGSIGTGLAADGNRDGQVTQLDYDVWRANFGATSAAVNVAGGEVPEPSAFLLLGLGATFSTVTSRRRRSGLNAARS
ncbi:MAG: family 43 glycosylhydrolase [Planctomycetota bacterium]